MADLNYLINFDSNTQGIDVAKQGVNALAGAMAALGVGVGLQELAQTADAYATLAAKIKVAVGETGNVGEAMAGVQQIAIATNSDLDATANLFAKINDVGKQMGLTQAQSLDLTKTINQAISLSGGSAQAAQASITQLNQALASGVLRGDEFNSINEQAPKIMKALANSLQVTTGELRTMASEGKLSSQVVIEALQSQAGVIEDEFSKFPKTIGQAMQNIKTQWQIVVGEFDSQNGASAVVVKALQSIGDNLSWLKNVFNDVGSGVSWLSEQLSQIDDSTVDELKNTLSVAYDTVKDLAKSIGDMGQTAWGAFKTALDGITPFFTAFTDGQKQVSSLDAGLHALQLGLGLISDGATGASIAFNVLVGGLQFLQGGLSALQAKLASFMGFDDFAKQAQMASDRLFEQAIQSMKRADDMAMNFKSKALQNIEEINKSEAKKNAESLANHKQTLAQKSNDWQAFILQERNFFKERQQLEQGLNLARQLGDDERIKHYTHALNELDSAEQQSTKTRQALEKQKTDAVLEYAQSAIKANQGVISEQLKAELSAQGFAVSIENAGKVSVSSLGQVAEDSQKVGLSLKDMAINAAKGLSVDVPQALNQINTAFASQITQVRQVADGYNELKKAGLDAGSLILASMDKLIEGAKNQKEIDKIRQLFIQFGQDGKLSTEQVAQGMDAINDKVSKTPALMDETTKAFKALGIISKEHAKLQAEEQIRQFELVKNSGQASSEQLKQALDKVQRSIATSGDTAQSSWLNGQKSALGLSTALENTTQSANTLTKAVANIGNGVAVGVNHGINELNRLADKMHSIDEYNNSVKARISDKTIKSTTNQVGSRTGASQFLKQSGLDDKQALAIAGGLDNKNGIIDWGKILNDHYKQTGQLTTATDYLRQKAESLRFGQSHTVDLSPQDIAQSVGDLVNQAEQRAKKEAKQEFANQLRDEFKRLAR